MCKQMLCYVAHASCLRMELVAGMQVGLDDNPTRFLIMSLRKVRHVGRGRSALCCRVHLAILVVNLKATSAQSLDLEPPLRYVHVPAALLTRDRPTRRCLAN
jgi:hypothetical protein